MNDQDYNVEKDFIFNVARINGYDKEFVDNIFRRHTQRHHTRQRTTLTAIRDPQKVICLPFFPKLSNPLSTVLRKYNINVATDLETPKVVGAIESRWSCRPNVSNP